MRWLRRIAIVLSALLLIVIALFFAIQSDYAKAKVTALAEREALNRFGVRVHIENLRYDIYPAQAHLGPLTVYGGPENNDIFLTAREISVTAPLGDLIHGRIILTNLVIDTPNVDLKKLPHFKSRSKSSGGTFQIQQIHITGGSLNVAQFPLKDVTISGKLDQAGIEIPEVTAKVDNLFVTASGKVLNYGHPQYQFDFHATGSLEGIAKYFPSLPQFSGPLDSTGKFLGETSSYSVEGSASSTAISLYGLKPFPVTGKYRVDSTAAFAVEADFKDAPIEFLHHFKPSIPEVDALGTGNWKYEGKNIWNGKGTSNVSLTPLQGKGIPLQGSLTADWKDDRIFFSKTDLRSGPNTIQLQGSLSEDDVDLLFHAKILRWKDLSSIAQVMNRIPGSADIDATLKGPYERLIASGNVKNQLEGGEIRGSGSYDIENEALDIQFQGDATNEFLNRMFSAGLDSGKFSFQGTAKGNVTHPALQAEISAQNIAIRNVRIGAMTGTASSDGTILHVDAKLPDLHSTALLDYRFSSDQYRLQASIVDLQIDSFKNLLPASAQIYTGNLTGNIDANGTFSNWRNSDATISIHEGEVKNGDFNASLQPDSVVKVNHGKVDTQLKLTTSAGAFEVSGGLPNLSANALDIRIVGDTDVSSIKLFNPELQGSGTAHTDIHIHGTFQEPLVEGDAGSESFSILWPARSVKVESGNGKIHFQGKSAQVQLGAQFNDQPVQVAGTVPLRKDGALQVHVTGSVEMALLHDFQPDLDASGVVNVDVTITGTLPEPLFQGKAEAQNATLQMPARKINYVATELFVQGDGKSIHAATKGSLNGANTQLVADIPLSDKNGVGKIQASLQEFPLHSMANDSGLSGTIDLELNAEGRGIQPQDWTGSATITPNSIRLGQDTPVQTSGPLHAELKAGILTLDEITIQSGELLKVNAGGNIDFKSQKIDFKVSQSGDASLITKLFPQYQAGGNLSGEVNANGSLKNPQFTGKVQIENGTFRSEQFPLLLERIHLVAPIDSGGIHIQELQARAGGGTVDGSGEIKLNNWSLGDIDVTIKGRKIGVNYPENLRSQVSADLKVTKPGKDFLIAGNVDVLRSYYQQDIVIQQSALSLFLSQKESLATLESSSIRLNLTVRTIDDFRLKNNLAELRANADLKITGNTDQPRISGKMNVAEGSRIYFQGNRYEFERGTITFYGGRSLDPVFDLELSTTVQDFDTGDICNFTIPIRGSTKDLRQTQIESDDCSSLTEFQKTSLLLSGTTGGNSQNAAGQVTSQVLQQQIAGFLTGSVLGNAPQKLIRAFGLSRIDIRPSFIASEDDPGTRVIVGKDFSSSLSLVYSFSVSSSGDEIWYLNYRPYKRVTFRLIDEPTGSETVDFHHTVLFGPGSGYKRNSPAPSSMTETGRIEEIKIENDSPLTEAQLRKTLKVQTGDKYDYWDVQDRIQKIQEDLQKRGFLFPQVEFNEKETGRGTVELDLKFTTMGPRAMRFDGVTPDKNQIQKYMRWWREGFSDTSVIELIREDLSRGFWNQGFHRVSVTEETLTEGNKTTHVFHVSPGVKFAIAKFVFEGNKSYRPDPLEADILTYYATREEMVTESLHRFSFFKKKVEAVYVSKGFLDTKVTAGNVSYDDSGSVQRHVVITEGSQSKIADIQVTGMVLPAEVVDQMQLKKGSIYDPRLLQNDQNVISRYYRRNGYRDFSLNGDVIKTPNSTDITIHYDIKTSGIAHIRSIEIVGNQKTRRSVIQKRLKFKEGDVLTRDKVTEAEKNLSSLGVFGTVEITAQPSDEKNEFDVRVLVQEKKKYEFSYGVRYDTTDKIGGDSTITDNNFVGIGYTLSLFGRADKNTTRYGAIFHSPTIVGLRWNDLFSVTEEREDLGLTIQNTLDTLYQRQFKFGPFLALAGYEFTHYNLRAKDLGQPIPFDVTYKLSEPLTGVIYDSRDDLLNAHRGQFLSVEVEFSPGFLGSDFHFVRNYNQYFYYRSFGRSVFATGVRAGFTWGFNPLRDKHFFAGGSTTIRGFETDKVGPQGFPGEEPPGGESVLIINEELRFPLFSYFGGVVFYDGGNVWAENGNFSLTDLRSGAGFGLRVNAPFGLLRFDVGFNLDPLEGEKRTVLYFSFGQSF